MFERQRFNTREFIAKGFSTEQILEARLEFEKDQDFLEAEYNRDKIRLEQSKEASIKYYADKEANGGHCLTCGCKLSVANTSGYCRKHVAKVTLGLTDEEKANRPKPKSVRYKTITFYGVKGSDLMDNKSRYFQGGSVSPR